MTLLDGTVVAVDRTAGRVLWTFDSGAPLVSAKQSPASSGFNVFPGADGGLYAYHGASERGAAGLEVRVGAGNSADQAARRVTTSPGAVRPLRCKPSPRPGAG